jgi:transposase
MHHETGWVVTPFRLSATECRVSDEEWMRVAHLFSSDETRRGGRRKCPDRSVLDAVLWVMTSGEKWHRLPSCYPAQQTCYNRFVAWRRSGLLDQVVRLLGWDAIRADVPHAEV